MVISELKWTKRTRIAVVVLCVVLGTAGLVVLSQMNQVAEAAILTPVDLPTIPWTVISGTWAIENGEYSQSDLTATWSLSISNVSHADAVIEAKVKRMKGNFAGIAFRVTDINNAYFLYMRGNDNNLRLLKRVSAIETYIETTPVNSYPTVLNAFYQLKVQVNGSSIKCYFNGQLTIDQTDEDLSSGYNGLVTYGTYAHFDDVRVTDLGENELFFDDFEYAMLPTAYTVNVRARATQIFVTCTWTGSGNITITLESPTAITYHESNMNIYEKTTMSFDGTTPSIFNIKRARLSIAAPTSSEIWMLYLSLSDVTTHQVSVEIS